ncbi:MAG: SRPBCC family protein [Myxococcales bacterium]
MRMERQLSIDAPAERVFALVSEPERMKAWIPELVEIVPTSPEQHVAGATFRQKLKEGSRVSTYDGELLACTPPAHLAVKLQSPMLEVRTDFRLTDEGGRTRLDYTCDVEAKRGWLKLLMRLFSGLNQKIADEQMRRLKAAAER